MDIIGGGSVKELGIQDELHHQSDGHAMWQDSVVLVWWDLANHIGGFHRIGHQPDAAGGPRVHLSNNFFSEDNVFKRCSIGPLRPKDSLPTVFGCGDDTCRFEFTDHAIWTFEQPEVSGKLHIHDFHPPLDIYPKKGEMAEKIAAGHLEVGSRVTGALKIDGKDYQVDGLAFRDHGWGVRDWDIFVAHRWIAGTFGPDLTVLAVSVVTTGDQFTEFGCVIRGNTLTYTKKLDILTYMESDALTHRGGHLSMELTTGEVLEIELVPLQKGAVSWMADAMSVNDTLCKMLYDGRTGICDFEISTNPGRGRHQARFAINAVTVDGLHEVRTE